MLIAEGNVAPETMRVKAQRQMVRPDTGPRVAGTTCLSRLRSNKRVHTRLVWGAERPNPSGILRMHMSLLIHAGRRSRRTEPGVPGLDSLRLCRGRKPWAHGLLAADLLFWFFV